MNTFETEHLQASPALHLRAADRSAVGHSRQKA